MTSEQIAKIKRQVDGKRPKPKVYAVIDGGIMRRVDSIGSDFVRVYEFNERTRIDSSRIVGIHIWGNRDGLRVPEIS